MAQVPSKIWTPFMVLSAARELAKTVDQQRVLNEQGRMFYRMAISEIVALLNSSADPSYWTSSVLTISADQELLSDTANNGGIITSVDSSAHTVTRSSGSFVSGSLLIFTTVVVSSGANDRQWVAKVTSGGATATYEVIDGTERTLSASYGLSLIIIKSLSTSTADISSIKYDRVVAIQSSNGGFCIPVTPSEFFSLGRTDFPHKSYDDDIVYTQMGNTLYFKVGSKISGGIGTVTMYYQRQPDYPSTDANYSSDSIYVDLADKWIPLLVKRIYTYCILQTENDIPKNLAQEMQLDYAQINNYAQSELQNKMKKELIQSQAYNAGR